VGKIQDPQNAKDQGETGGDEKKEHRIGKAAQTLNEKKRRFRKVHWLMAIDRLLGMKIPGFDLSGGARWPKLPPGPPELVGQI
jgi:hypothetical protein